MKLVNIKDVLKEKITNWPLFTGTIVRQSPVKDSEGSDLSIDYISFKKGVHNKFHKHENDQVLIVTQGKGFVETKNKKSKVKKGDIIWTKKGEIHRHGAVPGSSFTHISITRSGTKLTQIEK